MTADLESQVLEEPSPDDEAPDPVDEVEDDGAEEHVVPGQQ